MSEQKTPDGINETLTVHETIIRALLASASSHQRENVLKELDVLIDINKESNDLLVRTANSYRISLQQ